MHLKVGFWLLAWLAVTMKAEWEMSSMVDVPKEWSDYVYSVVSSLDDHWAFVVSRHVTVDRCVRFAIAQPSRLAILLLLGCTWTLTLVRNRGHEILTGCDSLPLGDQCQSSGEIVRWFNTNSHKWCILASQLSCNFHVAADFGNTRKQDLQLDKRVCAYLRKDSLYVSYNE